MTPDETTGWSLARTWRRVLVLASAATYLWVLFLLALWVLGPMVGFRWQPVMIDAGSMLPVIQPGDVVLVDTDVDVATLDKGTIITFAPGEAGTGRVHTSVWFSVDDVAATYTELKGRGYAFNEEPTERPDGGSGYVTLNDLDGNIVGLVSG